LRKLVAEKNHFDTCGRKNSRSQNQAQRKCLKLVIGLECGRCESGTRTPRISAP
jgi:hypothetical protein